MRRRAGVSLIEVLITIVLLGIILGPQISLLHTTNRYTNMSLFELLAIQYAAELGEQLQKLGPHLKDIRQQTGMDLEQVCSHQDFLDPLNVQGGNPFLLRLPLSNPTTTDVGLFITPLEPGFLNRTVFVEELDSTDTNLQIWDETAGIFWKVTVGLRWQAHPGETRAQAASFSFILREDTI